MAKGFNSRGIGGMGGGFNMNMIKQAQKMQQDMQKMQEELENKEYTAQAGGGVVSATVSGKHELKSLAIDPAGTSHPTPSLILLSIPRLWTPRMWRCCRISL